MSVLRRYFQFFLVISLSLELSSCQDESTAVDDYGEELNLYIPTESQEKLDEYVDRGLKQELLTNEEKKYVSAGFVFRGDTIPIELRLKGDLTDHIVSEKISYRIKLPDTNRFYGSSTFSIQHPKTREYVSELFMHRLFKEEGLTATTFEFCRVTINGEYKGVYAFEGHFDDPTLMAFDQLPGPVLKFDESNYWSWKRDPKFRVPMFDHARILPFKKSATTKDPERLVQFQQAANLLMYYRDNHTDLGAVFDLDKVARYWALLDFGNVKHSRIYRNHRYYYNPITTRLEMIGFDMHAGADLNENVFAEDVFVKGAKPRGYFLEYFLFNNPEFRERYMGYLRKYSSEQYIDEVERRFLPEMRLAEALIQKEEPDYLFDFDYFRNHAKTVREKLDQIESQWDRYWEEEADSMRMTLPTDYELLSDQRFLPEISVNAYTYFKDGVIWVQAENFHLAPVNVLGYSLADDPGMYPLEESWVLPAYTEIDHPVMEMAVKFQPEKIIIQPQNDTTQRAEVPVLPWKHPVKAHPRLKLSTEFDTISKWYDILEDRLIFHGNGGPIDELLYIPAQYKVTIAEQASIQFQEGGGLIVNNDFEAVGKADQKIVFEDLDGTSKGLTILGSATVELDHLVLKNLQVLNHEGWKTFAPFTIFEANLRVGKIDFETNTTSPFVHLIRSNISADVLEVSADERAKILWFASELVN